MVIICYHF